MKLLATPNRIEAFFPSWSKSTLLLLCFMCCTALLTAQTPKVAFVGVTRTDSPDGFSFVAGEDLADGTVIYFTDEEYRVACGAFHFDNTCVGTDGEPYLMYTTPTGGLAAGEVVFISETTANVFTVTGGGGTAIYGGSGGFTISASDALHAFTTSDPSDPLDNVTEVYASLLLGGAFDGGTNTGDDPRLDFPKAVVTILNAADGEFNPALRSGLVTDAEIENLANWNITSPAANTVLSTVNFTGGIDLCPMVALICPTIGSFVTPSPVVCEGEVFLVTGLDLANFDEEINNDQTYGLRFVAFTSTPDDPYTGGTDLGTVPFGEFIEEGSIATLFASGTLPVGNYEIYAVLSPVPEDSECRPFASGSLEIVPLPEVEFAPLPTIDANDYAPGTILSGQGSVSPTGGTFSSTATDFISDDGNGMTFSVDLIGAPASYTVTYTYTDANGCTVAVDRTLMVTITPTTLTAPENVCIDAGVQTGLSGGSPSGGVYSGPGITDDGNGTTYTFDPAAAGVGVNTITYTRPSGSNATATVEVYALPEVSLSVIETVSLDAGVQTGLGGGTPTGGVYSGPGVTDDGNGMTYTFDPATAGSGPQTITYTFSDDNECSTFATDVTTVTAAALPGDVCSDANDISPLFAGPLNVAQTSDTQDNTGYDAANDPGLGYECWFGDDPVLNNTIWYAFTGDGEKYAIRSIACGDNPMPNTDTQFALYSGDCTTPTSVACNDDEDFDNAVYNSYLEIVTESGVDYLLMVDGYVAAADYEAIGNFCLEVTRLETVGVTNVEETLFSVFPNPTTGLIRLPDLTLVRAEAYDATGRLVISQNQPGNQLDLTAQPAGLYLLKMYSGEEIFSAKVVKK